MKLDLSNNKISEIDPFFFNSEMSLTHLNLAKNHITTIPERINLLKYLKMLDISSNRIKKVPLEVFENLKILRIEWPIYQQMIFTESISSYNDSQRPPEIKVEDLNSWISKLKKIRKRNFDFFDFIRSQNPAYKYPTNATSLFNIVAIKAIKLYLYYSLSIEVTQGSHCQ